MGKAAVSIEIVSDEMCPWCFIGKRRLEKAIGISDAAVTVTVRWRPYRLDPTIPAEGIDRKVYLERKFGDAETIARIQAPVLAAGDAEGIPFAMEKITRSPNTLDAHRLIRWAEGEDRQDAMVERLFSLYFVEGADLTRSETLADAAAATGLDRAAAERLLRSGDGRQEVEAEIE